MKTAHRYAFLEYLLISLFLTGLANDFSVYFFPIAVSKKICFLFDDMRIFSNELVLF